MNRLGYDLMSSKKTQDAIEVFKLNVERFPQSWKVYDSLGEAYMANGDREPAIKNYERSIELNPKNTGGIEALKKLRAQQPPGPRQPTPFAAPYDRRTGPGFLRLALDNLVALAPDRGRGI